MPGIEMHDARSDADSLPGHACGFETTWARGADPRSWLRWAQGLGLLLLLSPSGCQRPAGERADAPTEPVWVDAGDAGLRRRGLELPGPPDAPIGHLARDTEQWIEIVRRAPESAASQQALDRLVRWVIQTEARSARSRGRVDEDALEQRDHRVVAGLLCGHFADRNAPEPELYRALCSIARSERRQRTGL